MYRAGGCGNVKDRREGIKTPEEGDKTDSV